MKKMVKLRFSMAAQNQVRVRFDVWVEDRSELPHHTVAAVETLMRLCKSHPLLDMHVECVDSQAFLVSHAEVKAGGGN